MTKEFIKETRKEMLIEALEYYIYRMKKDNCNQAAIDVFTELLEDIEEND